MTTKETLLFLRTENKVYTFTPLPVPTTKVEPEVTHHVMVVDRSGSMYGDIDSLKSSIEQVLAVESIAHENVKTTLISFSSTGDVTLHWAHVPANQVLELNGPYLKQLRSIKATYLTGISQGLNLALDKVMGTETTGITLFTDGYANDPSSSAENKALDAFVERASTYTNVFVNCIGFRDWCDWPRMEKISNALSGKCVKAKNFTDVLAAMRETQALLAGSLRPVLRISPMAKHIALAVNRMTGQINAAPAGQELLVRGVGANDTMELYHVGEVDPDSSLPKHARVLKGDQLSLAGALARALTGLGRLRNAKEVLFASGNKTLWAEHQSAMTPSTLAAMTNALSEWVKMGNNAIYEMGKNTKSPHNLFDLANAINRLAPRSLSLDHGAFMKQYRYRSIRKVAGTRNDDGSITPPLAELVHRQNTRTYVKGVSFNTSDASIQIDTETAVWVKRLSDQAVLTEVGFVSLEPLKEYKSYTLLSSGERNVETLPLLVYTKAAWEALSPFASKAPKTFTAGDSLVIPLKKFRMEAARTPTIEEIRAAVDLRMKAQAETKLFSAMQDKAEASPYSSDQLEAFKALHLTSSLYFSAPSTVHYRDRDEAVRKGLIDSFTRYTVNFGTASILDTGAFRSGNAFLDRRYKVTLNGQDVAKPKLDTYLQGATYSVKPPNPKSQDTDADVFMAKIADALLLTNKRMKNEEITERLTMSKKVMDGCNDLFQPLVMEIGCTGLLPAELESVAERMDAEQFSFKYDIRLGKAEKEAMFYVLPGDLVISIVPETSWYTVKMEE